MKYLVILGILIYLLIPSLVSAETTFFDQGDSFIMSSSTTGGVGGTTGGTTGEGGCLTNWTCSSWGSCINGNQIRNCTKEKDYCYADLKKKPIESQNCSIDKSEDKNNAGSEDGITNSPNEKDSNINNLNLFSIKIIILVVLIVIVIGFIIFYKRHKKRRYFRYGY